MPLPKPQDPNVLGLSSFRIKTRFGSLHYVGPKSRTSDEVIIFLHGFGSNWAIWIPLIEAARRQGLLSRQDIVLVDLPSFGESENQLGHLNSREIGQELLALVDTLGYTQMRVAGHSMGGFLALDLAANSTKVLSIHLVAGSYLTLIRVVNSPVRGLFSFPGITMFYLFQQLVSRNSLLTSVVNRTSANRPSSQMHLYKVGGKSFLYASKNGIGYDAPSIWGAISAPVYAAFGSQDKLVPQSDMQFLQKIIPSARLSLIQGAGHSMLVSHPAETAKAIFSDI
jgi:pimeloyl-ACP methyl ester carboxylesterase